MLIHWSALKKSRKLAATFLLLLALIHCFSTALAEEIIWLPDQSYTLTIGASAAVQRQPGTEIRSFEMDQNRIVWTTLLGGISGDKTGSATLYLEEYDTDEDTLYKTKIHVTVKPRNTQIQWAWDKSGITAEDKAWTQKYGNTFPVGKTYSIRHTAAVNGVPQQVIYISNQPSVASVDQNGLVTMKSPGTACVSCKTADGQMGYSTYFIVYDANSTGVPVGGYEPADPGARANIYQRADESSPILTTIGNFESLDHFYLLSRGDAWCRVTFAGYTGYMKTDDITFYGGDKTEKQERKLETPCTLYVQAASLGTLELKAEANFRSAVLGNYPTHTKVYALEADQNWAKVQVEGKTGYMNLSFLTAIEPDYVIDTPSVLGDWRQMMVQTGNNGKLFLRKGGSTDSAVLGEYANGTMVQASYTQYGDWLKVKVNGKEGYMMAKFLTTPQTWRPADPNEQAAPGKTMVIQTGNPQRLHLRKEQKTSSASLGLYQNGTQVTVHSLAGEWAQVTVNGKNGYMMLKFLADPDVSGAPEEATPHEKTHTAPAGDTMIVKTGNSGGLYLRKRMKTNETPLGLYKNGTQVQVIATSGAWAQVQVEGKQGYMMLKFLAAADDTTIVPAVRESETAPASPSGVEKTTEPGAASLPTAAATAVITHPRGSFVNLRSGPHTDYRVLEKMPHGSPVEVLSSGEYWSRIRYQGMEGYVVTNYLK